MAGRSSYSDADRARVYAILKANDGIVKRTHRETGVPEQTVRRWKQEWESGINVPAAKEIEDAVNSFVQTAEKVRDFALETLVTKIPDAKPGELITIVGVLDDKISRARGLDRDRNLHVHHHLPSAEEIRAKLETAVNAAIALADKRQGEIVEAKVIRELPPGEA